MYTFSRILLSIALGVALASGANAQRFGGPHRGGSWEHGRGPHGGGSWEHGGGSWEHGRGPHGGGSWEHGGGSWEHGGGSWEHGRGPHGGGSWEHGRGPHGGGSWEHGGGSWEHGRGPNRGPPGGNRQAESARVQQAFTDSALVNELIDAAPPKELEVVYPGCDGHVRLGNNMTPYQVRKAPEVKISNCGAGAANKLYTLVLVDASSKGDGWRYPHWLVGNIPGRNVSAGVEVYPYASATPPEGAAPHRYTFLLYEQPATIDFSKEQPGYFDLRQKAKDYNFGKLIAGNFFLAESDDYSVLALKVKLAASA